jgi:hypothetical protein
MAGPRFSFRRWGFVVFVGARTMWLLSNLFGGTAQKIAWNTASRRHLVPLTKKAKTLERPIDIVFTTFVLEAHSVLSHIIGPDRPKKSELPFRYVQLRNLDEKQWGELYTIVIASLTAMFLAENPLFQIFGRTILREMVTNGLLDVVPKPEIATQFANVITNDTSQFGLASTNNILNTLGMDTEHKLAASDYITRLLLTGVRTATEAIKTELTMCKPGDVVG